MMRNSVADLILFNANVLTMDPRHPRAQLIAILNDRVLSVSNNDSIAELRGSRTELIDCRGGTVIPGFNDAHFHLAAFAESLVMPSLEPSTCSSISRIQNLIRSLAWKFPPGSWIRLGGYHEFYLAEKRHPTRRELDEATSSHPVKLSHQSGHAHVLNSLALKLAGISMETPEPPGGMIERDLTTGEPNGLLYGMGGYLARVVPPLTEAELTQGIRLANEKLLSLGITSVQDASPHNDLPRWQMFQQWKTEVFRPGINMMAGIETIHQFQEQGFAPRTGDHRLRLGAVKIMLDETSGQLNPPQAELNQKVLELHQSGFQVAFHALEENTIEAACAALEQALRISPRTDHRHRIEHCSVCTPEMAKRLASIKAMVVTQPSFIYYNGERYLKTVPAEQLKHLYPVGTFIKAGLKVAAGSDCPVVPPNPLHGLYAAVSRAAETGQRILSGEGISPFAALQLYTGRAACACFEETIKGSIAPGKLADVVVLTGDPAEVAPEERKRLEVALTIIGGEILWRRGL